MRLVPCNPVLGMMSPSVVSAGTQPQDHQLLAWLVPSLQAYLEHAAASPATPIWPVDLEDDGRQLPVTGSLVPIDPEHVLNGRIGGQAFAAWNGDGLGALNFIDTGRIAHLLHKQLVDWLLTGKRIFFPC